MTPPSAAPEASALRAWLALVRISFARQIRARQMVFIALGLLALATAWVAVQTARGQWGMSQWRSPRRVGYTYAYWHLDSQAVLGVIHRDPSAAAFRQAFAGSVGAILSPDGTDADGNRLGISAFQVFSQTVVFGVFLTFLLPLWSLAFATESLGGERESRSLIWLLMRPMPRWAIYSAKFVALLPWAVGLNLGGFAILCLAGGPPGRLAFSLYWPAVAVASTAFAALFLLVGAVVKRPAVVAIVYSFCLEVVLGNMPGYLKRVSVGFYARCIMYEEVGAFGIQPDRPGVFLPVTGTEATMILAAATFSLLALGMWLFSRTEYHETD